MPDWELSARLLTGKGLSHFARKGNLLIGGFQFKSETRESFVETCVYHGGGGKLPSLALLLSRQSRQTRAVLPQMLAPTQRQDRRGRQRHRAARTAAPCRLFRRPCGAARLSAIGWGRVRGVRCERDCDRANLRGEPDLLSAELPGDRGFQAAYARRAGRDRGVRLYRPQRHEFFSGGSNLM